MALKIGDFDLTVQIHKAHTLFTPATNVPTAETEIFRVEPAENQVLIFPKDNLLCLKLYDVDGNEITGEAELSFWRVDDSGQEAECFAKLNYSPWKNLDFDEQFKEDYRQILGISFLPRLAGVDAIHIRPGYRLECRLKASKAVNWDNANTAVSFGLAQELIK